MTDEVQQNINPDEEEELNENKGPSYEELQRQQFLDPEGGYANQQLGLEAEKKAMMSMPPLSINALPTKMYLE